MKRLLLHIVCVIWLGGCQTKKERFEHPVFSLLEKSIEHKSEIDRYKEMEFDSAVIHFRDFPLIFYEGVSIVVSDSVGDQKLEEYYQSHSLDRFNPFNSHVFAGAFHNYLTQESISMDSLKIRVHKIIADHKLKNGL